MLEVTKSLNSFKNCLGIWNFSPSFFATEGSEALVLNETEATHFSPKGEKNAILMGPKLFF